MKKTRRYLRKIFSALILAFIFACIVVFVLYTLANFGSWLIATTDVSVAYAGADSGGCVLCAFTPRSEDVEARIFYVLVEKDSCLIPENEECAYARSGPSSEYDIVHPLQKGMFFEVVEIIMEERNRGWYKIRMDNNTKSGEECGIYYGEEYTYGYVSAKHVVEKYLPPTTEYDPNKWIVVDVSKNTYYAYDGGELVNIVPVSIGKISTSTIGYFIITEKYPMLYKPKLMGNMCGLPGIGYALIMDNGEAFHSIYFDEGFGNIGQTLEDAEWLYYWATIGTGVYVKN